MGFRAYVKEYSPKFARAGEGKGILKSLGGLGKILLGATLLYGGYKGITGGLGFAKNYFKAGVSPRRTNNPFYSQNNPPKLLKYAQLLHNANNLWYNGNDFRGQPLIQKLKEVDKDMSLLDELVKKAQLEKLAEEIYGSNEEEEEIDPNLLLALLAGLDEGEEEEESDEGYEKIAEAYYTGQIMAQGFIDALGQLEKEAEGEDENENLVDALTQLLGQSEESEEEDKTSELLKLLGVE